MRVLKVVAEGLTTSFRYPHFMQAVHPTFEMPPPATIYGHICSALGEWVSPEGIEFAYQFTHQGIFDDMEHVHVLTAGSGKLPGTDLPKALQGAVNPFVRSLLFRPRLVLYINRPEWEAAFRSPHYAVVLGRSQDLFTYTSVRVVELTRADRAYFQHTLAPYRMALLGARGYVVLMPRFLDYENGRSPSFARYLLLKERVHTSDYVRFAGLPVDSEYWVDPETEEDSGAHLGLAFHTFVGEYDDNPLVA
ncbi:MAG TPA: CRISPR-associated protein Cas5 [Anaerolineae bacterium]|nr:CRISPR-associated protein Cas5 [Anaerolineae bacterium]HOR00086.1 CRISPR-associated protein Cas5 [Anaerolineae bacterium]HPL26886.1 CRISPR-associated protein Cas5 [Anaerolineae bacterium]